MIYRLKPQMSIKAERIRNAKIFNFYPDCSVRSISIPCKTLKDVNQSPFLTRFYEQLSWNHLIFGITKEIFENSKTEFKTYLSQLDDILIKIEGLRNKNIFFKFRKQLKDLVQSGDWSKSFKDAFEDDFFSRLFPFVLLSHYRQSSRFEIQVEDIFNLDPTDKDNKNIIEKIYDCEEMFLTDSFNSKFFEDWKIDADEIFEFLDETYDMMSNIEGTEDIAYAYYRKGHVGKELTRLIHGNKSY